MFRNEALRRGAATLVLLAWLAPGPALAQTLDPSAGGGAQNTSLVGAFMSVACGAGINVSRHFPAPIVIVVTAASCFLMVLDAINSADPN